MFTHSESLAPQAHSCAPSSLVQEADAWSSLQSADKHLRAGDGSFGVEGFGLNSDALSPEGHKA